VLLILKKREGIKGYINNSSWNHSFQVDIREKKMK